MQARSITLVDDKGRPLEARIERTVLQLLPRMKRQFPSIRDEATTVQLLEETARRVAHRERERGALVRPHGYAWVTLKSVVSSHLRRGEARLAGHSIAGAAGIRLLAAAPARSHTHRDVERRVLAQQLLAALTPGERRVCLLKHAGYSTREIARLLGRSAVSVDTIYCRARAKARRMATEPTAAAPVPGRRYPVKRQNG